MSEPVNTPLVVRLGGRMFLALWGVGVLSWFYTIWEAIQVHRLRPAAFRRGLLVLSIKRAFPHPDSATFEQEKVVTNTGQFRFINPSECLFSPYVPWFSPKPGTPFPIKGRIRLTGSVAEIEGRIPLGTSLFVGSWVLGTTSLPVIFLIAGTLSLLKTVGFIALFAGFALGLIAYSLPLERRRAETIIGEIESEFRRRTSQGPAR